MKAISTTKLTDAVLGFVVGDAFGVPYEFNDRNCLKSQFMIGYGTWNQPIGTWSDDSSMMLATLESIKRMKKIDTEDIMNNFMEWFALGKFTPHGTAFDVGNRTRLALSYYAEHHEILPDPTEQALGNGALMRILPLAFFGATDDEINAVNDLTHPNTESRAICRMYVHIVRDLLRGKSFDEATDKLYMKGLDRELIASSGYIYETFDAVIWSVANSDSYMSTILKAVNLGGDTDTIAALAGGLAGIIYGRKNIPKVWLKHIARLDWIIKLCEKSR